MIHKKLSQKVLHLDSTNACLLSSYMCHYKKFLEMCILPFTFNTHDPLKAISEGITFSQHKHGPAFMFVLHIVTFPFF